MFGLFMRRRADINWHFYLPGGPVTLIDGTICNDDRVRRCRVNGKWLYTRVIDDEDEDDAPWVNWVPPK
jgi:hypothetical protein